jgi:hypothetical protein
MFLLWPCVSAVSVKTTPVFALPSRFLPLASFPILLLLRRATSPKMPSTSTPQSLPPHHQRRRHQPLPPAARALPKSAASIPGRSRRLCTPAKVQPAVLSRGRLWTEPKGSSALLCLSDVVFDLALQPQCVEAPKRNPRRRPPSLSPPRTGRRLQHRLCCRRFHRLAVSDTAAAAGPSSWLPLSSPLNFSMF